MPQSGITYLATISGSAQRTQTGISRISATFSLAQTGVSNIVAALNQTGVSRLTGEVQANQTGVSFIVEGWSQLCTPVVGYSGHPCALCRTGAGASADYFTIETDPSPLVVEAAQTYLLQGYVNAFGTANGTVSLGLVFYNAAGAELSSSWISSTGSPASYTLIQGTITVPANAVTALLKARAVSHTVGRWCFGFASAYPTNRHLILSSLKHYFSKKFNRR